MRGITAGGGKSLFDPGEAANGFGRQITLFSEAVGVYQCVNAAHGAIAAQLGHARSRVDDQAHAAWNAGLVAGIAHVGFARVARCFPTSSTVKKATGSGSPATAEEASVRSDHHVCGQLVSGYSVVTDHPSPCTLEAEHHD